MPMSKTDYEALGRYDAFATHAQSHKLPDRGLGREAKSWQAQAYWGAYKAEAKRLENIRLERVVRETQAPKRGTVLVVMGPLYPYRRKARSIRGWTTARA